VNTNLCIGSAASLGPPPHYDRNKQPTVPFNIDGTLVELSKKSPEFRKRQAQSRHANQIFEHEIFRNLDILKRLSTVERNPRALVAKIAVPDFYNWIIVHHSLPLELRREKISPKRCHSHLRHFCHRLFSEP